MVLTDINVKVSFKVFIYVLQKVTADWPIGLLMVCKHIMTLASYLVFIHLCVPPATN